MRNFDTLGKKKVVIGMLHLGIMPGTPFYEEGTYEDTYEKALQDARALYEGGADGCLVQTVDRIYSSGEDADYARVIGVANIVRAIAQETDPSFQIGVQLMINALKPSLAIAKVCGGSFLRAYAYVGATLSPSGMVDSNTNDFLQYRKLLQAQNIKIVAEVDGVHFHWFGGKPTVEVAQNARYYGADAVEVANQDEETVLKMVHDIKHSMPDLPVIIGGYTNHENVARILEKADGAFVGSCLEEGGRFGRVSKDKVRAYVDIVDSLN